MVRPPFTLNIVDSQPTSRPHRERYGSSQPSRHWRRCGPIGQYGQNLTTRAWIGALAGMAPDFGCLYTVKR
ncbi:MAG: hypothetical protein CM15mP74_19040 [Halieaceae bacterium]|nr:MAG: hypothetical protein CM15mP74_19040 [Halieaceae bacterium]